MTRRPRPTRRRPRLAAISNASSDLSAATKNVRHADQIGPRCSRGPLDVHRRASDRVATGSGNAALPRPARMRCVGSDYVPALLDRARRRAEAEGLEIEFVEGDAEALPFADGSFDVVSSVFGAMFAPNQEQAASELARVARSGGRIGVVAHTPDGFIGNLFKAIGKHVPPPAGLRSPIQWGTEPRHARAVRRRDRRAALENATSVPRALDAHLVESGALTGRAEALEDRR